MTVLITGIVFGLVAWCVMVPVARAQDIQQHREYNEALYLTKLRLVRKYYPSLSRSSYMEIAKQYDVEDLYDNIGRRRRRAS